MGIRVLFELTTYRLVSGVNC